MSESPLKKQALLIGINQYAILPALKYARQDAEAVEQALKQNYCFSDDEVMLLTDAKPGLFKPMNKRIIQNHLENLVDQELDLFIFGFWGHGVFRNGERYLCPLDVMSDAVDELGFSFKDLQQLLSRIKAKNTCLILDCCQKIHDRGESEVLTVADQVNMENAARDIVLKRKEQIPEFQSNVAILNSCKQGQAAYEWDNRQHGIFTAHLLDALNRRFDSVAKIIGYISSNVEKTAMELGKTQTPFYKLEGDISLPIDTQSTPLVTGDVFISYRHCNINLVEPVEEELKKRGISYFIDRMGVSYSMDYSEAIARAVKECKVLLFVWTQDANGSVDMLREAKMALDLKKRVLPYKIGTFNVVDHSALYYQLSPLSRYEVPKQTPDTVVELVNRVELALTGKTFQQYSFILPEKSQDAVIQKPEIEEINVTFTPELIEQQQAIQYKEITLPPLSEDLLRIQAENRGLQTAIEQLKEFSHESLAQANSALEQAQAQFDAWKDRKERLWKDLPQVFRQSLEKTISKNPECTENDVDVPTGDYSYQQYFDFLEQFQCGKKYEQAKRELERVKRERLVKCNDAIALFQQKIQDNGIRYKECSRTFLDEAIMAILVVMPGFNDVNASFPETRILEPLRQLDQYKLGWRADEIYRRTRTLWREKRPCLMKTDKKHHKTDAELQQKTQHILTGSLAQQQSPQKKEASQAQAQTHSQQNSDSSQLQQLRGKELAQQQDPQQDQKKKELAQLKAQQAKNLARLQAQMQNQRKIETVQQAKELAELKKLQKKEKRANQIKWLLNMIVFLIVTIIGIAIALHWLSSRNHNSRIEEPVDEWSAPVEEPADDSFYNESDPRTNSYISPKLQRNTRY